MFAVLRCVCWIWVPSLLPLVRCKTMVPAPSCTLEALTLAL